MTGQDQSHDRTGPVTRPNRTGHKQTGPVTWPDRTSHTRPDRTGHMTVQDCHMSLVTWSYRTKSHDLKGPVSHLTHNDHWKQRTKDMKRWITYKQLESTLQSLPHTHTCTHTTYTHTQTIHTCTHTTYTHTQTIHTCTHTHIHTHTHTHTHYQHWLLVSVQHIPYAYRNSYNVRKTKLNSATTPIQFFLKTKKKPGYMSNSCLSVVE